MIPQKRMKAQKNLEVGKRERARGKLLKAKENPNLKPKVKKVKLLTQKAEARERMTKVKAKIRIEKAKAKLRIKTKEERVKVRVKKGNMLILRMMNIMIPRAIKVKKGKRGLINLRVRVKMLKRKEKEVKKVILIQTLTKEGDQKEKVREEKRSQKEEKVVKR